MSVSLSVYSDVCLSVYSDVSLSVYSDVSLSVYSDVCLSVYSASLSDILLHRVVWSTKPPRVCGCCVGG